MLLTLAIFLAVYFHNKILDLIYNKKITQSKEKEELKELITKRNEIGSTIEQFNNPSTFAQYSKGQRLLNKLEEKIEKIKG